MRAINEGNSGASADRIEVWITPVVEADYAVRDVFAALRGAPPVRILNNATKVYDLCIEDAEKLLGDAQQQNRSGEAQRRKRGLGVAYRALASKIDEAIKHAKGLWDDPGVDKVAERIAAELALFKVGQQVRVFAPGYTRDGSIVVVSGEYRLRRVKQEDGPFVAHDGLQCTYKWGYKCVTASAEEFFYAAADLQTLDYEMGHLRLVVDNCRDTSDDLFKLRGPFAPGGATT